MVPPPSRAGQIIRINLENFMSYDNIEIYPGQHLNLIVGPNGTGKSSIVCAVLLCLGGKLKTLGRADQLSSYVKSGCNQSCIEIELYEPKGTNVIIKRKISSNNQSEFVINGTISPASKVNEIRKKYNIQIDNLCTFLPQEKVQDFARLNPRQLLDQTQRTIGDGGLVQAQEELKKLQVAFTQQEKQSGVLQADIDAEKQKNDRIKDKVECYKEKQLLSEKIVVLNQKKAWLKYQKAVTSKEEVDLDVKEAEKVFKEKKAVIEKFNKELSSLNSKLQVYEDKLNEAKKNEAGKKSVMDDWLKRAERRYERLEDLGNIVQARLDAEESKKQEMMMYKQNVEKLTNDLKALDTNMGSEEELEKRREEVERKLKDIHGQEARLNQTKVSLEGDEDSLKQLLKDTNIEYQTLKRRRDVRIEYLKKYEPDVYQSMEWLEKHRDLFQSRVYNPMLLELNVPNSKMAKFVESHLAYRDLIAFTCSHPEDLNLMVKKLRKEQNLKINVICSEDNRTSHYVPEIPISNLRDLGFHSYLKDLITGPDVIITFLCRTYRIHCIPVGDEKVMANCEKVPRKFPIFYSEDHVYSVKHSIYTGERSTVVKKLPKAKFFAQSMESKRIEILAEKKKNLESKVRIKQAEIEKADRKLNELRMKLYEVKKEKKELGTSTSKRDQVQMSLKLAKKNYNCIKSTLRDPSEIENEVKQERQKLQDEIIQNLKELKEASENFKEAVLTRQKCELEFEVERMGKTKIEKEQEKLMKELSHSESLLRETKERQKSAERLCLQLKVKAKKLTDNIGMEESGFEKFEEKFAKLSNSIAELQKEIDETEAKIDFLQGGSLQMLEEYEKREAVIAGLIDNFEKFLKKLEEKRDELNAKQEKWLKPVSEMVSSINEKFGKFFETMGCAGEVSLVCGESKTDFDQYGIKIRVKFRDGAPLQDLGRFFQSGGERAVATAIFMLSLQELTSVPFRFVDEINQGMDPANERRILELIISVTASTDSMQYFFITPKLLHKLECSETMTVHCIHNGPSAIPATEWDLREFLKHSAEEEEDDVVMVKETKK